MSVSPGAHSWPNHPMLTVPPIIGHRGACAHAPENTLASFAKAADLGCAMVEFDVRLSADGVPIVFHDDLLERCTDGLGPVGERTIADLRRLDAGRGQRIPTLSEVLALCIARGLAINMEIKPDAGAGTVTARAALDLALRLWPATAETPLISSFDPDALVAARALAPSWPRGLLVETVPPDWRDLAARHACASLHADHHGLDPAAVAALRGHGLVVLAYTVNDPNRAKTLWDMGVQGIFSDDPGVFR